MQVKKKIREKKYKDARLNNNGLDYQVRPHLYHTNSNEKNTLDEVFALRRPVVLNAVDLPQGI